MKKTALITGITGQDGSYLAELLLKEGYRVVGMTRRTSTDVHERIQHIVDDIEFVSGDLLDQSSITGILATVQPDEIYNLAAQSFVPTSFSQPVLTGEFTALGVTRVLEAVRTVNPNIRFYQASSSEMFGKVQAVPQNEATAFYPRSPYGVAKLYGHWITINYRESYDLYAVSGILFNHESVRASTPVIVREGNLIDIRPIGELLRVRQKGASVQNFETPDLEIWDGDDFTRVLGGTAYKHRPVVDNKGVRRIEARCGTVTTTADHVVFTESGEVPARDVTVGTHLQRATLPEIPSVTSLTLDAAWLMGAFVGDGSVWVQGTSHSGRFTNSNATFRGQFASAWERVTCGYTSYNATTSAFNTTRSAGALALNGAPTFLAWLHDECYTDDGFKRIPQAVLNGDAGVWRAFLCGYNQADGLKAGSEMSICPNFTTNSATLAMGLWWLARRALDQECVLSVEGATTAGKGPYYSINLRSEGNHGGPLAEVKRIVEDPHFDGWLYDFTTESQKFHAGVGECIIHNSPRRGKEFVTRKITDGVARIKLGLAKELRLGNLDARRDWGFAGDFVRAMWLMLQQDRPDDYVVATGATRSVGDFVRAAFAVADLDWERYVVVDPRFYRPAEVDLLVGDYAKARDELSWEPETSFERLVESMVLADLERLRPFVTV